MVVVTAENEEGNGAVAKAGVAEYQMHSMGQQQKSSHGSSGTRSTTERKC
jgi:hypothetical protein